MRIIAIGTCHLDPLGFRSSAIFFKSAINNGYDSQNGRNDMVSTVINYSKMMAKFTLILGPIFSLNFAGQAVVVINDFKTAAEIFGTSQYT